MHTEIELVLPELFLMWIQHSAIDSIRFCSFQFAAYFVVLLVNDLMPPVHEILINFSALQSLVIANFGFCLVHHR